MSNTVQQQEIVIGTRVYTNLYARGHGTVYAIHGQQNAGSVRVLGGIMHTGGGAKFDIVFDNGSTSEKLPECILRGVQWRILDDAPASADKIAAALANAACVKANKQAAEQQAKAAYAAEVARLKSAPEYAHLTQGDDAYSGKLAAVNIRVELKREFPGVKFSVRKSDHGCVRISWTDGPLAEQVEEAVNSYKGGSFNGMEDIYEYSDSPWVEVFGGAKYIFASRDESPALVQKAIDALFDEYPASMRDIEKPTPEAFKKGETWAVEVPGRFDRLQTLISRKLATIAG